MVLELSHLEMPITCLLDGTLGKIEFQMPLTCFIGWYSWKDRIFNHSY
jgi:hypothetical protein